MISYIYYMTTSRELGSFCFRLWCDCK